LKAARHEIPKKLSKARTSSSAREPDYSLLNVGALENEKELPLRKNAQVDAILRQKSKGTPEKFCLYRDI
jgi:hypothetical protein